MKKRFLDHVAGNPLLPEVLDTMMPYFKEEYGNPLSMYDLGMNAREAIEDARNKVAELINAEPSEIIFTSSGAEANNFALRGVALAHQNEGKHAIVSKMEHHSILNSARVLEKMGFVVTYLPVDKYGMVDPETVRKSINKETKIISVIHASSEVGTIEPIKEISEIAHEKGVVLHTDAVATVGNIPVDVKNLGVDLLSMTAHQFYGPKGAAALYLKRGQRINPLIYGGIQEGGRRAGTENVPAIVGMGKAAELARNSLSERMDHVRKLRDKLLSGIKDIPNIHYTGHPEKRLPGHASMCVEYIEGEGMLLLLAGNGFYAASGSACTSKALKASPVLVAMGIPSTISSGSIVFSFGIDNTEEDVSKLVEEFPQVIEKLRAMSPFAKKGWEGMEEGGTCTAKS